MNSFGLEKRRSVKVFFYSDDGFLCLALKMRSLALIALPTRFKTIQAPTNSHRTRSIFFPTNKKANKRERSSSNLVLTFIDPLPYSNIQ